MLTLLIILVLVGVLVSVVPMDSRIRTAVIVIAIVWAIAAVLGYGGIALR